MCVDHLFPFLGMMLYVIFSLALSRFLTNDFIFVADFQQIQRIAVSLSVSLWVVCSALSITSQMRIENSFLFHRLLDFNLNYLPGYNHLHIPYCQFISDAAARRCSWKETTSL